MNARSILLSIPGRVAPLVEAAAADEVRALIAAEMAPALALVSALPPNSSQVEMSAALAVQPRRVRMKASIKAEPPA